MNRIPKIPKLKSRKEEKRRQKMEKEGKKEKRQNAILYRIIALHPEFREEEQYIGSTFNDLRKRFSKHRESYGAFLRGKCGNVRSYSLFDKYGVRNCEIIQIRELVNVNKRERDAVEYEYIRNNPCCNHCGKMGYVEDVQKYKQKFYADNKEEIHIRQKEYYKENKEKIQSYQKKYNEEHREEIRQKKKEYNEEHSEEIRKHQMEQILCECGSTIRRSDSARHLKTNKHKKFIQNSQ